MSQLALSDHFFDCIDNLLVSEKGQAMSFVSLFRKDHKAPGISLERVRKAKSSDIWSGRVSRDLRAILFKDQSHWFLLHVNRHDDAYRWAENFSIECHPITGALQIVESVQATRLASVVKENGQVESPVVVQEKLLAHFSDEYLLSLGTPIDWLPILNRVESEDKLLEFCEKLPEDVAERLMCLAAGEPVEVPEPVSKEEPFQLDLHRRFYLVENEKDLFRALQSPMEKWMAFLHPSQRAIVKGEYNGPVKVTGSAGTGKTVVAMHRAQRLARDGHKVLLTSYGKTLCQNLSRNLALLCSEEELENITISNVHRVARKIVKNSEPSATPVEQKLMDKIIVEVMSDSEIDYTPGFVRAEWINVILAKGIISWPEYRSVRRTGRGKGLSVKERKALWTIFKKVFDRMKEAKQYSWSGLCLQAGELIRSGLYDPPYDSVIVDEVQDLKAPEINFLWALGEKTPGHFMIVGDAGQRIYPGGFSLRNLGIEVRGRSKILRLNYRTTEQIRRKADIVIGGTCDDMDGGIENRNGTRSILGGPDPVLKGFTSAAEELRFVAEYIKSLMISGLRPEAIAVFTRTAEELRPLVKRLGEEKIEYTRLADEKEKIVDGIRLGSMHRAKGLEFKAVLIMGCNYNSLPHPKALADLEDPLDIEEARSLEQRLLYVAMTRARDELYVTWNGQPSQFLEVLLK